MTENAITRQIDAARAELRSIEEQLELLLRRRDIARAKLEAFEVSAKYIAEMASQQRTVSKKPQQRSRLPSSEWLKILGELYSRYNSGFGYDDIMGVASTLGVEVKRASLRTKMMSLANDGYVDRVSDGEFVISAKGVEHFGFQNVEVVGAKSTRSDEISRDGAANDASKDSLWG